MSSRRSLLLPITLMLVGLGLLVTASWWAWKGKATAKPSVQTAVNTSAEAAVDAFYRPAESDWWLVLANEPALAKHIVTTLSALDPATPLLPGDLPTPLAMAAAGPLRLWQFTATTAFALPATTETGRWHIETLTDATVLFWLPNDVQTTAVDRVSRPPAGTGMVRRQWLAQRLGWPEQSCDALPALLQQLPEQALLQLKFDPSGLRWHLFWSNVSTELWALLQTAAAPQAQSGREDRWFWREADLTAVPRAADCPSNAGSSGFVARLWQQDGHTHAALARPGQQQVAGFPLPVTEELQLKPVQLAHARGLSNSSEAQAWLSQQSLIPDPGVLLAVQHHSDGEFAGLELSLRTLPDHGLQLQWQWPQP